MRLLLQQKRFRRERRATERGLGEEEKEEQ
jgi:hypothetical protein